ncbi:unnamed protein product (macronuclear) [Paramecium tetraurelia]|uniref:Nuclear pore protein n=1 Tax=Paramecium tetraurelia TaxID=5888 RepID=A0DY54_PARTE|nr:uncharacterized protein GSPATT00002939001 [Paramecium tetraurelia]CAK87971.1 unnamed protein product [Paramecium tetraurelia]|eukprot:XP_001455368.1 hypothetical protein (macronuclear) [Paramecium tetraurelia strain d4-2]
MLQSSYREGLQLKNALTNIGSNQLNLKSISQDTIEADKIKEINEKTILTISISTNYMLNRMSKRFDCLIPIKKTQCYLIDEMGTKVDQLFKKFNLQINNVDYMSDHIKRLTEKVNQDIKIRHSHYNSNIKIQDYKNYSQISQDHFKNKQTFNSFSNIEQKSRCRQRTKLVDILKTSHRIERLVTNEFQLNQYNEVILEKLFIDHHLYQVLQEFNKNKKNPLIYEKLFRTLENFETPHKVEMKLLADQFKDITQNKTHEDICEKIIRNTVTHLENDMLKQIGHIDLQNLNRKFKEYYLPYLHDNEIYQVGQFYPSGILLVLMRCGKINEAEKILQTLISNDQNFAQQFLSFFDLVNLITYQKKVINQNDVEEKYRQQCCDIILQQCYWLLMDVSEAYDVFEETKFQKDKDFFFWMILKTAHVSENYIQYERQEYESKKSFPHWTLAELHEVIPQTSVCLRTNLFLQRYDYILNELYKIQNQCLSQIEYFILNSVITTLNIKSQINQDIEKQTKWIIDNIVNYTQNKYPLISCLILSVAEYNTESIANLLQRSNHVSQVLSDKTTKENLESIFGLYQLLKIINEMVHQHFEKNLHSALKDLQQQLAMASTKNQISDCQTAIFLKLDEMSNYIRLLLNQNQETLIETAIYLYHETQFVLIIASFIVNQYYISQLGVKQDKGQHLARNLEILHPKIKSLAKTFKQYYYLHRFQLIEIFQLTSALIRQDQISLNEINSMLVNINVRELSKCLLDNKQVHLMKMVFCQILYLIQEKKDLDKSLTIAKIKEFNETLLKYPVSQGIRICKQEVQFSQSSVDILNNYSKILQIY